jgi:uncharacterized protein
MIAMAARISVRVHPGAKREALRGRLADGALRVDVSAPPEGGRANAAVCALIADVLGVRASDVRVVHGAGARRKLIEVVTLESDEVERRLAAAGGGSDGD